MPALIYAPEIRIYIDSEKHGIIDVSEDNVDGSMTRRSDGVSVMNFSLQNPRRKYDSVFTPNDRVVVMMKRVVWLRTFTGYLNSVPLVTAWPRVVPMAASCSLKRLQYWYWDAYTQASLNLVIHAISKRPGSDGGVTNVILNILEKVVGWKSTKVHVSQIPADWFKFAEDIAAEVAKGAQQANEVAQQYIDMVGADGYAAGTPIGDYSTGVLQDGVYGGQSFTKEQLGNAQIIYNVGKQRGLSNDDVIMAIMTSLVESGLKNLPYGDRDSLGLFQQRPSAGWGTQAQILDPKYSAGKFYDSLTQYTKRGNFPKGTVCQWVQRSAYPDRYAQKETQATAIVASLASNTGAAKLGNDSAYKANQFNLTTKPNEGTQGTTTHEAFVSTALKLVHDHPSIQYLQVSLTPSQLKSANPPHLDCSSFTRWVYYHTLGSVYDMPPTSWEQYHWCLTRGKTLTVSTALKTPGALLFVSDTNNPANIHHVEISVGDGQNTVGAHRTGRVASVQPANYNKWNFAGIPPRIDFTGAIGTGSGSATDYTAGATSGPNAGAVAINTLPGFNPSNRIDNLFGDISWVPVMPDSTDPNYITAQALVGIRALLNDQPLLPYLKNLFNSTMRSFCSAPNGDLIAWFPDYYGLWGTAAKLVIEPIELKDFSVEWADDAFVTHQFTMANATNSGLALDVGGAVDVAPGGTAGRIYETLGIATIDIAPVLWALFGIKATDQDARNFAAWIYQRFGARPDFQQIEGLTGPKAEFFSALYLFMRQWAYQYNADVPLTFMPEAWPGMLVQIPAFNFQAYITTVTHTWRFGENGGFSTVLNIAAPARMPRKKGTNSDHVLLGLPLAGGYAPGRGVGNAQATVAVDEGARQSAIAKVKANNIGDGS